jgi:hypothetical protein
MRARFDAFAKELCSKALEGAGEVRTEVETIAETKRIDLVFAPDASRRDELAWTGLLADLTVEPCSLEFFHDPPSTDDVLVALHRHLSWFLTKTRSARNAGSRVPPPDVTWLLSAGRPSEALSALGFAPIGIDGAGHAAYAAAPGLRSRLLVLSELPETPHTLLLRLMGRGAVLRRALRELVELEGEQTESGRLRDVALPILTKLRFEVPADPAARTPEEHELMTTTQQLFDDFVRTTRQQGIQQGVQQGVDAGRVLEARRLLRSVIEVRGLPLSTAHGARIDECDDLATLTRWHARAITAADLASVFAD